MSGKYPPKGGVVSPPSPNTSHYHSAVASTATDCKGALIINLTLNYGLENRKNVTGNYNKYMVWSLGRVNKGRFGLVWFGGDWGL